MCQPTCCKPRQKQSTQRFYSGPAAIGRYDHAFYFYRQKPSENDDKIGATRLVCAAKAELTVLDLEVRIKAPVAFVDTANGIRQGCRLNS